MQHYSRGIGHLFVHLGSNRSQHPGMVIAWLPNDNKMEGNLAEFIKWLRYKQLNYDNN